MRLYSYGHNYALDVVSGKIKQTKIVQLACKRYLDDLDNAWERGYYFDTERAWHAIDFIQNYLKHWQGKFSGKPFILEPWQQFIIWNIFGWVDEYGNRRFQTAYVEVPRKNGKSPLAAAIILYLAIADGEEGAEVYTAATKKDQAKITFNYAKNMLRKSEELLQVCTILTNNISLPEFNSKIEPLGADADTMDGLSVHGAAIDEVHAHKTSEVIDVVSTATGTKDQPLIFEITTAGKDTQTICYIHREYSINVLKGVDGFQDDNWFTIIFGLEELKADSEIWKNPEVWAMANPNMDVSLKRSYFVKEFKRALVTPSYQPVFKQLHLGIWSNVGTTWIEDEDWQKCRAKANNFDLDLMEFLKGKTAFAGLDLAKTMDINAYTLFFPDSECDISHISGCIITFLFCPEDQVKNRSENKLTPYSKWAEEGHLIETPGNVRDDDFIINFILDLHKRFDIQSTAYDPWEATNIAAKLQEQEIEMNEFRQGFKSMSQPTKEFEKMVISQRLQHDGNPVMRWMMSNVMIVSDPAENIKIDKKKSKNKVDGPVSAVMALGEYMTFNPPFKTIEGDVIISI
ncbi:terminase large subunit [Chondrinema litorale]|uniref:terminase large subunit n=1 Tax=Chondrinema litorale TaxID=2994555 RepID=UPI0025436BBD|nr:terminase TerL endonuclease subunit [Chondrinema litorale]UZS00257.1 terminase large subunit [Chondrinema litorale]